MEINLTEHFCNDLFIEQFADPDDKRLILGQTIKLVKSHIDLACDTVMLSICANHCKIVAVYIHKSPCGKNAVIFHCEELSRAFLDLATVVSSGIRVLGSHRG